MTKPFQEAYLFACTHSNVSVLYVLPSFVEAFNAFHAHRDRPWVDRVTRSSNTWTLINGSVIHFGYAKTYLDAQRYLSSEFHKVVIEGNWIDADAYLVLMGRERLRVTPPSDPMASVEAKRDELAAYLQKQRDMALYKRLRDWKPNVAQLRFLSFDDPSAAPATVTVKEGPSGTVVVSGDAAEVCVNCDAPLSAHAKVLPYEPQAERVVLRYRLICPDGVFKSKGQQGMRW